MGVMGAIASTFTGHVGRQVAMCSQWLLWNAASIKPILARSFNAFLVQRRRCSLCDQQCSQNYLQILLRDSISPLHAAVINAVFGILQGPTSNRGSHVVIAWLRTGRIA